jgi:hypothetical protein
MYNSQSRVMNANLRAHIFQFGSYVYKMGIGNDGGYIIHDEVIFLAVHDI